MIKRETRDTTVGNTGGGALKGLSNDVVFGFFNDEKIVKIVENLYNKALSAEKDSDQINASKEILDRVLGKAKQVVQNDVSIPQLLDVDETQLNTIVVRAIDELRKVGKVTDSSESTGE